jgi:hypothetical protein
MKHTIILVLATALYLLNTSCADKCTPVTVPPSDLLLVNSTLSGKSLSKAIGGLKPDSVKVFSLSGGGEVVATIVQDSLIAFDEYRRVAGQDSFKIQYGNRKPDTVRVQIRIDTPTDNCGAFSNVFKAQNIWINKTVYCTNCLNPVINIVK